VAGKTDFQSFFISAMIQPYLETRVAKSISDCLASPSFHDDSGSEADMINSRDAQDSKDKFQSPAGHDSVINNLTYRTEDLQIGC